MARVNKKYREEAKKRIIDATIEVAAEKGWDVVTLDAIARNVGVTIPALYSYFKNRDMLVDEVILEVARDSQAGLKTILAHDEDIHRIIRSIADQMFDSLNAKVLFQMPARGPQDPQHHKEIARVFNDSWILIRDCLTRAKSRGDLAQRVDPDEATRMIFVIMVGIQTTFPFMEKQDLKKEKKIWIEAVERSLLIEPCTGSSG